MKNYIEIQRLQTVRIPIIGDWIDARNALKNDELFDHDNLFDFDKSDDEFFGTDLVKNSSISHWKPIE